MITEKEEILVAMVDEDTKSNLEIDLANALIKLKSTDEYKLVVESYLFGTFSYDIFTQLQSPYIDKECKTNLLLSLDCINILKLQVGYKDVASNIVSRADGAKGALVRNVEYRKELNTGVN